MWYFKKLIISIFFFGPFTSYFNPTAGLEAMHDVDACPAQGGDAPKKPVPEFFVGTFSFVTSKGGYVSPFGHYSTGVGQGISLTIKPDGTGSSVYHVEAGSYTGALTTDDVVSQCTFEIVPTNHGTVNITIHYISGKDYHNNRYLHDLPPSKVYPNGDMIWNDLNYGVDNNGKHYFIVPGKSPLKFTKN